MSILCRLYVYLIDPEYGKYFHWSTIKNYSVKIQSLYKQYVPTKIQSQENHSNEKINFVHSNKLITSLLIHQLTSYRLHLS